MHMPAGLMPDWLVWLCNAIALVAVLISIWRMDRSKVHDVEQGMFIGVTYAFLTWIYSMNAGVTAGMTVHFLGVMLTVMMFGPWLGLVVLVAAQATVTFFMGMGAPVTLGFNITMCVVLPVAVAAAVHTFCYYKLPRNFPVYIIQVGIGDLICMAVVDAVLTVCLLTYAGYMSDKILYDFTIVLMMMGGMEATISTMIASLLVCFLPQALTTFSDQEYLDGK